MIDRRLDRGTCETIRPILTSIERRFPHGSEEQSPDPGLCDVFYRAL